MATNIPQDDWTKSAIRLPKELHAKLHEAASASGRSYNSEMVERLERSFIDDAMNSRIVLELKQDQIQIAEHLSATEAGATDALSFLVSLTTARELARTGKCADITLHALDEDIKRATDLADELSRRVSTMRSEMQRVTALIAEKMKGVSAPQALSDQIEIPAFVRTQNATSEPEPFMEEPEATTPSQRQIMRRTKR